MAHITITTQALPEAPPTPNRYQELVADVITALDRILEIMPKIDEAEASGRKVAGSRLGVPDAFLATTAAAVEQSPELAAMKKLDPSTTRDNIQYREALRPLYDKVVTVGRRLYFTLLWMKDSDVADALQIYRIAKELASDRRSPLMTALVANMKRDLGKKVPTKADREERKLTRMMEAITEFQQKQQQTQEVQKAA